ncbi:MAG: hypothetical protein ACTSQZ_03395 [Candidatus Thorarchaeota archaeon]
MTAFEELLQKTKERNILGSLGVVAHWDLETYMPPGAIGHRSEQLGVLTQIVHRMSTSVEMGELISAAEKEKDTLEYADQREIYLTRKGYDEATKVPEKLIAAMAKQRAIATNTWKKAKAAKDWKMFEPELQKNVELREPLRFTIR